MRGAEKLSKLLFANFAVALPEQMDVSGYLHRKS
jgi:hypothetical protein